MAAALVNAATCEKLREVDWAKNIEVCEFVSNDIRAARDAVKAIKKRLGNKHINTQLFSVMLLEMLMNNIGEPIYKQVIETGVLSLLVKMVKKKSELPVRERIFLLLDATQTALGGASGKFPQYYNAYYNLVSAGVQFPQRPIEQEANKSLTLQETILKEHTFSPNPEEIPSIEAPDHSIIQKAGNSLEVLREVLNAIDPQNPEGATDEFTLDLVEQCSFQKQRVMHLVMTSRDEKIVSQAIELNDQLQKVLQRHDELVFKGGKISSSDQTVSSNRTGEADDSHVTLTASTDEDEEEPEQLFRRLQKGKARADPDDELTSVESFEKRHNGPVIRPAGAGEAVGGNSLPPPPSKHLEREKFFQEKKVVDTSVIGAHLRGISISSHSASSSRGGSVDFAG